MTVSRSTALVPVSTPSTSMVAGGSSVPGGMLLAGEDVTLRDREEVRNRLPDILGRALARSWLDPDFEQYFSIDPLGALENGGVHLPQTMFIEVTKSVADRPKIVVYERQEGSKFKSRVLYLQLVMVAGK
ncbi:hypothetical protein NIG5292_02222 [Nereida ignava]|uniref:Uncharacterized protein n=1 Tax=Nereida ignava TaxID=282199 RepID=A0A0U1NN40_9RHOB|nr:hypothetical protein NIG5292_02222 [Nereida ignava]SFJ57656.1 hypothetical protein SAMN02745667_01687 [Nereida ignava DSM 16309]